MGYAEHELIKRLAQGERIGQHGEFIQTSERTDRLYQYTRNCTGKRDIDFPGSNKQNMCKVKPPPPIAPKPRPWSMVGADRKSGEFSLLSDGSSTNTSAANTPDSGDALDESTDSGVASMGSATGALAVEKRSVRELAASLNKQGGSSEADNKRKGESDSAESVDNALNSASALSHLSKKSAMPQVVENISSSLPSKDRKLVILPSRAKRVSYVANNQSTFHEDEDDVVDV